LDWSHVCIRNSSGGGFEKKMKIQCDVSCEREKLILEIWEVERGEMRNVSEVKRWREFI
jgi:hypothetical protein